MPTFENGWICRECWCANRDTDDRCYRCHAVPKRGRMPEAITFSTPDGKPNEERKRVSSLIGSPVAPAEEATPVPQATPSPPLSERIRQLVIVARVRAGIAAMVGAFGRLMSAGRAVGHAPGAGARLVSNGVRGARNEAGSRVRTALSHRRAWLSAAWVISALSCALLFSVALRAPLATSILVVASVAIFSGLSAAITTNASERQARGMTERSADMHAAAEHGQALVPPPEHSAHPAEILGSRPAR